MGRWLVLCGSLALCGLAGCGGSQWPTTTRFAHPVRIKGQHVSILTDPQSEASAIATLSSADSVENIGRLTNQWSQVQLRDGREGFVLNQYLEDVAYGPAAARASEAFPTDTSYTAATSYATDTNYSSPATYAAPAAAYSYAVGRAGRRFRRGRSSPRFSRRAPAYRPAAPVVAPARPAKAPAYSTTYSTTGSSYRPSRPVSNSYRPSSSSASYRRTYSAPRVNYTFRSRSRSRSLKRRR